MAESTINQRLKILIDALGLSVNAFGEALGVPGTTARNYLVRGTNPKSDFLAKIIRRFENVSPIWLFTGEGDMLVPQQDNNTQTGDLNQSNSNNNQNVKGNKNETIKVNNDSINLNLDDCKQALKESEREVEHLRGQLARADALVASKDETIALLRIRFDRPN